MVRIFAFAAASAIALAASSVSAQTIINLPAIGTAQNYYYTTPTTLNLAPGTYVATVIGTASGGTFDGWNFASSGTFYPYGAPTPAPNGWTESYTATINGVLTTVGSGATYASAAAALAAATPFTFTVAPGATTELFQISDLVPQDNTGGVSLSIAAVPEASTWAMMIVGMGMMGFAMRRRRAVATNVSYAA